MYEKVIGALSEKLGALKSDNLAFSKGLVENYSLGMSRQICELAFNRYVRENNPEFEGPDHSRCSEPANPEIVSEEVASETGEPHCEPVQPCKEPVCAACNIM